MRLRPATTLLALAVSFALAGCASAPSAPTDTAATAAAPTVAAPALLSREVLFGNPERAGGQISHDGRWLAYLAPREGVMNIWVAPMSDPAAARPITNDRLRGIRGYSFAYDGKNILYAQDVGGDENFQVFAVDIETGLSRELTPKGARASVAQVSARLPNAILVSVNDRDPRYFDLVNVQLSTGSRMRIIENDRFSSFVVDDDFQLRYAQQQTPDGGNAWFRREGKEWKPWETVPQEDSLTTAIAGFTEDGRTLYVVDSRGRNTGALFAIDVATGTRTLVHQDARADVSNWLADPATGKVQAVSVNYLREEWTVLDPAIAEDVERLQSHAGDGEFLVTARTRDDRVWTVSVVRSDRPAQAFIYKRDSGEITPWFSTRPALDNATLAKMVPVEIRSRDGLTLPSYYTLPAGSDPDGDGIPAAPVPMVLLVHGGPWARDAYGFNGNHQWLANRGYAVLSVNFRASTGFGKAFVNAGDLQWGRKMHDDLLDAVAWAEGRGIAAAGKTAIMGGSYGGYATLAGLTMTPDRFACGVSIVGPSNLITLLETIPPYWGPIRKQFATRMGDDATEEGRALLKERSPLTYVDNIQRPLLIGQGANDPRVKQAESDQIVQAMQAKNIPVTYVLFPDEGHGFVRPQNRLSFNAVAEGFLQTCLGGRSEPIGDDFAGSSITVPTGADLLPGVAAALPKN
jgi:dipeptidyl aminopeptidase/acylaminoacyl peptidase